MFDHLDELLARGRRHAGRRRVYVSGPLSGSGDRLANVRRAMDAGLALLRAGFAPFVPHLSHFMDEVDDLGHATWLEVDLAWIDAADAVLRLPGASRGADLETARAGECGIPVFGTVADAVAHFRRVRA